MKPPKRKKLTVQDVAKNYKKNVKVKNVAKSVMNYQTGTDPKMDKMVNARMGMKVAPNSSYSGPVIETKRTMKSKPKAMSLTYGGSDRKGMPSTKTRKGKSL